MNIYLCMIFSNKSSQTSNGNVNRTEQGTENEPKSKVVENQSSETPTPSVKSATYSLKSTASAQSSSETRSLKADSPVKEDEGFVSRANNETATLETTTTNNNNNENLAKEATDFVTSPLTTVEGTLTELSEMNEVASESPSKWRTGEDVLQIEDVADVQKVEEEIQIKTENLKRNGSLTSLQSKTESIKTQLEDTPPVLSRSQSGKSLVIEEEIEDSASFVVVDDVVQVEEDNIGGDSANCSKPNSAKSKTPSCRSRSPTIEEIKALSRRNSMAKSMESLCERPSSKHEYIDNTTETSSQSSAQLNSSTASSTIPLKQHTPLKQKSKTTHFLKSHRRISPVKQSIKMVQAELFPSTLQRFEKPREALMKTFDQLDSTNWEVVMLGLKNMVRLIRYHPENLDMQMHMVCIQLTRSVRNLRSQVARAACTAATELFTLKSRYLEQECDDLVCALLHRTADTNRFIRADATRALESMCDNLTPSKILNILTNKGALHPNALVRTTTAKLLNRLVERLSCDKIYTMPREQRDKFFITGANLLLEGSLDTRSYAKSLFKLLSCHPNYTRLLLEVIPPRTYRNIEKTLKSIH